MANGIAYRVPIQQDFRVLPRLPESWKVGMGRNRGRLFARSWGVQLRWPRAKLADAMAIAHRETYPYDQNEHVTWVEPINVVEQITPASTVGLATTPLAWELVRTDVSVFGTFILEKIATYLAAQALDSAGAPVGAPFVTGITTDPFLVNPIPHPEVGVGGLQFAWGLIQDQQPLMHAGDTLPPAFAVGAVPNSIPVGYPIPGIPPLWADLRYAWGTTYTEEHHIVLGGGNSLLRLFAFLSSSSPDRWAVKPGGLLAGYWQAAGRLGAALNAASRRYP